MLLLMIGSSWLYPSLYEHVQANMIISINSRTKDLPKLYKLAASQFVQNSPALKASIPQLYIIVPESVVDNLSQMS